MNWPKIISGVFLAIFAGMVVWAGIFFLQMHRDLIAVRAQEAAGRRRLVEAQAQLAAQREYLERLERDPALVESLIRRKLGYVRSDEYVFRFEDERAP